MPGKNQIIRYNPNLSSNKPLPGKYVSCKVDNPKYRTRSETSYRNTDDIEEVFGKVEVCGVTINIHAANVKKKNKEMIEWGLG